MYIQITTRCNMHCAHCCFDCSQEGYDMSIPTFRSALVYAHMCKCLQIDIGGGEPTVHPQIEAIVNIAIKEFSGHVGITTNGKLTQKALWLANLSVCESMFHSRLSLDQWHEKIDDRVMKEFKQISSVEVPMPLGRELHRPINKSQMYLRQSLLEKIQSHKLCFYPFTFIKPNGRVYSCGCPLAHYLGNVNSGAFINRQRKKILE